MVPVPTNGRYLPCASSARRTRNVHAAPPSPLCNLPQANYAHAARLGGGPQDPATPGPTTSSSWNDVMRIRPATRYFKQLFALYAGLVGAR